MNFNVIPLHECKEGDVCWVEFLDCEKASTQRLSLLGFEVGARLDVMDINNHGIRVITESNVMVRLGATSANMVLVRVFDRKGRWEHKLE